MKMLQLSLATMLFVLISPSVNALFDPINDVTDRILVVYERTAAGFWVPVSHGDNWQVDYEWLNLINQSIDPGSDSCSTQHFVSTPFSQRDRDIWNSALGTGRIQWGGAIGGALGGLALGIICEVATLGSAEGSCAIGLTAMGATLGGIGELIGQAIEISIGPNLPVMSCGYSVMAVVRTCEDWGNHTPRALTMTSYHAIPGPCSDP